jgi:parvulin-like peptidyl-prolyl isomerase
VKVYKIGFALILAVLLIGASAAAEVTDRIVAVINDEIITLSEFNRGFEPYAKNIKAGYKGNNLEDVMAKSKASFLQRLIDQMLIEQEAKKAGMGMASIKDAEVMDIISNMLAKNNTSMEIYLKKLADEGKTLESVKKDIKEQLLRMRLLKREVQAKILVTDQEIGEYYDKHRQDYEGKEAVHIKLILLPVPAGMSNAVREAARDRAQQLHTRILNGEPFEQLAAQYSQGPAAAQGGDIGFVERGVILPDVEKVAFSLPVGQVSGVIETELGFQILTVVDKRGAGLKPFTVVREEIKATIEEEKITKKYDEWIEGIRKKSFIDVRL